MVDYLVKRPFPGRENLRRGEVITDPLFRNLPQLLRTGYLEEIAESNVAEDQTVTKLERVADEVNYNDLKRSELDVIAIEKGLSPEDYRNRKLLIEALNGLDV